MAVSYLATPKVLAATRAATREVNQTVKRRPVALALLLVVGLAVGGLVWRAAPDPVIRTTSLGEEAFGVAVDQATSRAFVITSLFFPASEPQGHVAVLDTRSEPGNLVVLDGATATIRRMVPFGYIPTGVAVDEQAGSVVVVDAGNQFRLRRLDAWSWLPAWLRPWLPFLPAPAPGTGAIPGTVTVLDTSRL